MKKILLIIALTFLIFQMVVLATAIDMGSPAVDGDSYTTGAKTVIERTNPANESGTITSVEVWVNTAMTQVQVATFEEISTDRFSTRDTKTDIGNLGTGYHQLDVSLEVQAGDYIGMYFATGAIEMTVAGTIEPWYKTSDQIPCTDVYFNSFSARKISLYATGATEEEEEDNAIFFGTNF